MEKWKVGNGSMEKWKVGILGFPIVPIFHHSNIFSTP
jgi:hypothetical protein